MALSSNNLDSYTENLVKAEKCLSFLPNSNWETKQDWIKAKSRLFKDLTNAYLKHNNQTKAVEYARYGINFDEKYAVNSTYDRQFETENVYLLICSTLFNAQKYREAIKYYQLTEKFLDNKFKLTEFISNLKVNNYFRIHNNDSLIKYTEVLENLCFCFMKTNQFDLGEEYFDKKSKMLGVIRKISAQSKIKINLNQLDKLVSG